MEEGLTVGDDDKGRKRGPGAADTAGDGEQRKRLTGTVSEVLTTRNDGGHREGSKEVKLTVPNREDTGRRSKDRIRMHGRSRSREKDAREEQRG